MPVVIPGIVGALVPNIFATGNVGEKVPQLATGIATGLAEWVPSVVVQTIDSGTAGGGSGGPMPLVVPQPALYGNLLVGATSNGLLGVMAPLLFLGIANGLVLAFAQMLIKTTHIGVGAGTGAARFVGGSAIPQMIAGFATAKMTAEGSVKMAKAIGFGLDLTFQILAVPIPIAGPPSPSGGSGVGIGNII
jgi:hypothetical protein